MIDIEDQLFAQLAKIIRDSYPSVSISNSYINAPARFPHVSIEEVRNDTAIMKLDTSQQEKYAEVTYEINIYSAKPQGKKKECKGILSVISDWMYRHNFNRYERPIPNAEDPSVYRIYARYTALTDGKSIYRR